jgi:hypothetical protein
VIKLLQGNAVYIRPKVVGPFLTPCASGSYMHWAARCYFCSAYPNLLGTKRLCCCGGVIFVVCFFWVVMF